MILHFFFLPLMCVHRVFFFCLDQRIMEEYEQDLRVLEEKNQKGMLP